MGNWFGSQFCSVTGVTDLNFRQRKVFAHGEAAMATVVAQTQKLSTFFGKIAQKFYNTRLASANREVEKHKEFLRIMPF
jgi:hypothetical protein